MNSSKTKQEIMDSLIKGQVRVSVQMLAIKRVNNLVCDSVQDKVRANIKNKVAGQIDEVLDVMFDKALDMTESVIIKTWMFGR